MSSIVNTSYIPEPFNFNVSDEFMIIYNYIAFGVLCQIFNILGVFTNIFNIICFVKQGLGDSVNISLLALSISDLISRFLMIFICISTTPALNAADVTFDVYEIMYLAGAMPQMTFVRVSSCITALITIERCLCITAPIKIKSIFTPTRTTVINICIFVVIFFSAAPVYFANSLGWKFAPLRNKTIVGIIFHENKERVEKISFTVNNFFIPLAAFVIIVVCTTILSIKLRQAAQWRRKMTVLTQEDRVSTRNQKTAKMVVIVSILFIVCFVPMCTMMLAVGFMPEMSLEGPFLKLSIFMGGFFEGFESINCSTNIFIYYRMSTKYRETFRKYVCRAGNTNV